jgi:hypothetical protein
MSMSKSIKAHHNKEKKNHNVVCASRESSAPSPPHGPQPK